MNGLAWMAQGACNEHDPELFFPHPNSEAHEAKKVCRNECPVAAQCLEYALEIGADFGVWGGLTEQERAQLSKRRAGLKSTKPPREYHNCGTYSGVSRHRKAGEWLCDPCMGARRDYEKKVRARRRDQERESA